MASNLLSRYSGSRGSGSRFTAGWHCPCGSRAIAHGTGEEFLTLRGYALTSGAARNMGTMPELLWWAR